MPRAVTYTDEMIAEAVSRSVNYSDTLRHLGHPSPQGSSIANIKRRIAKAGIDTSHFTFRPRSQPKVNGRLAAEQILVCGVRRKREQILRALLEVGVPHECMICGNHGEWNGKPLGLEIDHVDGDRQNNLPENIRLLCPNCHSQQPTGTSFAALTARDFVVGNDGAVSLSRARRTRRVTSLASRRKARVVHLCPVCGGKRDHRAKACRQCTAYGHAPKIKWPDDDTLLAMVSNHPYLEVARQLGVSDNAIRKRLRSRGLAVPRKQAA